MKLGKDQWKGIELGKLCEFVRGPFGGSLKKEIFVKEGYVIYEQQHAINNQFETFRYFIDGKKFGAMTRFEVLEGDIIMSCSGTFGKVAVVPKNSPKGIINQALLKLRCKSDLYNSFLGIWLNSPYFQEKINSSVQGTAIKNISAVSFYKQIIIPLPPLEEQKQIVLLFHSLEITFEKLYEQEKSLIALQRLLINGLFEVDPRFGNILNKQNVSLVKFGNVVNCIERHDKVKKDISRFIGLENIDPGNFKINSWRNIDDGTTFTKRFESGDVLFGKRRAYLKKVAVADFDGICSGDILVFRAIKEIIIPELLPIYVASEAFIKYAVKTSAGSLSPRTKWKDLKEFELPIPDLKTQTTMLDIFGQIQILFKQFNSQKTTLQILKEELLNEILG